MKSKEWVIDNWKVWASSWDGDSMKKVDNLLRRAVLGRGDYGLWETNWELQRGGG